ncbi:MAG: hypothetical protein ACI9NN_000531, partial [Bacteroidia bacterium]
MFMKKKILQLRFLLLPLLFLLAMVDQASAQSCNPQFSGQTCVGSAIDFKANSPGFDGWAWDFGDGFTGSQRDPNHVYQSFGTFTVSLTSTDSKGNFSPCTKTITVTIKPSPVAKLLIITPDQQCFNGNEFCFIDSSSPAPGSKIVRRTILFGDGAKYDKINPVRGDTICHTIIDKRGGKFDVIIELEDANGCISKVTLPDAFEVWPNLGIAISSNS